MRVKTTHSYPMRLKTTHSHTIRVKITQSHLCESKTPPMKGKTTHFCLHEKKTPHTPTFKSVKTILLRVQTTRFHIHESASINFRCLF